MGIYQKEVRRQVQSTVNGQYDQPVALVRQIGKLMGGMPQTEQFTEYLSALRTEFKRKQNFIKVLGGIR